MNTWDRVLFTYQITSPKWLTSENDDAVARQDTATVTTSFFGPHDSHDENPPQGQKYLETRIRQTHYRVTNRPRNIFFLLCVENLPDELQPQTKFNDYLYLECRKSSRLSFSYHLFYFANVTKEIIESWKCLIIAFYVHVLFQIVIK